MNHQISAFLNALSELVPSADELTFQNSIEDLLDHFNFKFEREVACENGRVDFVVFFSDDIVAAVEIKTKGGYKKAIRQAAGYLQDARFQAAILIAARPWKRDKIEFDGKTIYIAPVWMNSL